MDANNGNFSESFPPEFHITNDELFAAHHAGERAFFRHLDVYRQLDNEWICATRQQIGMTFAVGLVALLQSLRRLAMEGSSERGRAVSDFKGRHFGGEIVLWAVRWYCRYGISYRDLEQMMAERGVSVDHSTIYRWVQRYAPEIEKRLRWHWRHPRSGSWRVDETYVKVRGKWAYLYRAVDKLGSTIDFYLSPTRNTAAAKRFLAKALRGLKDWERPEVINTDKAPTYAAALAELKAEGKCPKDTQHRQVKYLNNIVEADHGKLKLLIRPVRGFKSMKTAYATIKGFEVMRALRKGQAAIFNLTRDIVGEARLVERAFGLGPCALTEAVQLVGERLAAA
jgi:transposase-like protein